MPLKAAATASSDAEIPPAHPVLRKVRALARQAGFPAVLIVVGLVVAANPGGAWAFLSGHVGLLIWASIVLAIPLAWVAINFQRWSIIRNPRQAKGREIKMTLRPFRRAMGEWVDAVLFQDKLAWRVVYLVLTVLAVATALVPATIPGPIPAVVVAAFGPLVWLAVITLRMRSVTRIRIQGLSTIHDIAAATLKYPRTGARVRLADLQLRTWWSAVQVKEWDTLTEARQFFVLAPRELSITDTKAWNEFERNINAKYPREGDWRVQRDPAGRGAMVSPANFPLAVAWEGQSHPDPLTFEIGISLDTFKVQMLTFGEVSPHMIITGATSSGKTSLAEAIAAQALVKPMPWDETLRATVDLIDPKDPLAKRWRGRPGVTVSSGARGEGYNAEGKKVSGFELMTAHLESIEKERQRRDDVLGRYPGAATWLDLPHEVLRAERFAPRFVILDEYLDHTTNENSNGNEIVDRENAARDRFTYLTNWLHRKARNVGIHIISVMQTAAMGDIGGQMKRNAVARVICGQMDEYAYKGMFNTVDVPPLPSSRVVVTDGQEVEKTIPGRALVMNATGQQINRIQVYWFGGPENLDALDEFLPRSDDPNEGLFGFTSSTAAPRSTTPIPISKRVEQAVEADVVSPDPEPTAKPPSKPVFPQADVDEFDDELPPLATGPSVDPEPADDPDADIPAQIVAADAVEMYRSVCEIAAAAAMTVDVTGTATGGAVVVVYTAAQQKVAEITTETGSILTRARVGSVAGQAAGLALLTAAVNALTKAQSS